VLHQHRRLRVSKLFKVCLDIEGNDKGLTVTTVAADSCDEAIQKAKGHVGAMNQNVKPERKIDVKDARKWEERVHFRRLHTKRMSVRFVAFVAATS